MMEVEGCWEQEPLLEELIRAKREELQSEESKKLVGSMAL